MADFQAYNYRAERRGPEEMVVFVEVPVKARSEEEAINKVKDMVESSDYRDAEKKAKADEEAKFAMEHRAAAEETETTKTTTTRKKS